MSPGAAMLTRIMELQAKETLTEAERAELAGLDTEWSNRSIDPRECPARVTP